MYAHPANPKRSWNSPSQPGATIWYQLPPKAKCWARLAPVRHTDSGMSKTVTLKSRELSQAWQHKPVIPAEAGGLWVLGQPGLYSNRLSPRQTNCRDGSMGKAGPEFKSHHSTHVCLFQEKRARHYGAHL